MLIMLGVTGRCKLIETKMQLIVSPIGNIFAVFVLGCLFEKQHVCVYVSHT